MTSTLDQVNDLISQLEDNKFNNNENTNYDPNLDRTIDFAIGHPAHDMNISQSLLLKACRQLSSSQNTIFLLFYFIFILLNNKYKLL